jgi:hypothetical protein
MRLTCGTHPGLYQQSERWLYLAERFDGTRFSVSETPYQSCASVTKPGDWIRMDYTSRSQFNRERVVCDGGYDSLLGWWPDVITAEQFGEAMRSMVDALRPHLRAGKLVDGLAASNMLPLSVFPGCASAFLAQFPPGRLLAVMDALPSDFHSPEAIARYVERTNRDYQRG